MKSASFLLRAVVWVLPVLALLVQAPASSAEIRLKLHHFLGTDSIPHTALIEPWAQRVERDSNGRIAVDIHPAMGLGGKAHELVDQARGGSVDIVWTAAAYTPERFPRTDVFSLPLVHRGNPVATNLAIKDLMERELYQDFPGLTPLLVHVHQGHAFHLAARSVSRIEEFAGLMLRPPGRGTGSWTIEEMGAETTKKRHPRLPNALADGKLDGALMSFNLAESMGVIEAVKSHTLLDEGEFFGTSIFLFLMNRDRYESLPEDLREVIDRNSGPDFAGEMGQVWLEAGRAGLAAARELGNGVDILAGDEAAKARQALQQVVIRWMKECEDQRIDGLRLVKKARKAIGRHTAD